MTRIIFIQLCLFLLPFVLTALILFSQKANPTEWQAWEGKISWATIAGLVLVLTGLIFFGMSQNTETGTYIPPHVEDGKLVPGQFK